MCSLFMQHSKVLHTKGILTNRKMLTQSQLSQTQFKGKIGHVKSLIDALKSLNIGMDALVYIGENGLQVIVEDSNCFQAVLYVTDSAFTEFELDGIARFKINLSVLCDCLGIFHSPGNSVQMLYKGQGAPLALIMEEAANSNCIIECSIKTQNDSDPLQFDDEARVNQIVFRSPDFQDILSEIEKSCEELQLTLSPKSPFFRLRTMGVIQSATEYQVDRISESIISFNCKQRTCFSYKTSQIKLFQRALPLSYKIAMSTDKNGLLTVQVILTMELEANANRDDSKMYIEYFILPLSSSAGQSAETEPIQETM